MVCPLHLCRLALVVDLYHWYGRILKARLHSFEKGRTCSRLKTLLHSLESRLPVEWFECVLHQNTTTAWIGWSPSAGRTNSYIAGECPVLLIAIAQCACSPG